MSKNYSAFQFENAFLSTRIQNWEVPRANDGRKLSGKMAHGSRKFSNYVGTWDMPRKLPSARMNVRTGRTEAAYQSLQEEFKIPKEILSGQRAPEKLGTNKANLIKIGHNKQQRKKFTNSHIDSRINKRMNGNDDDDHVMVACRDGVMFDDTVDTFEFGENGEMSKSVGDAGEINYGNKIFAF